MFILRKKTLITLHIIYWRPDYQNILQEFLWQLEDIKPVYPRTHKFLNFWHKEIDAVINEVTIIDQENKIRLADWEGTLM